MSAPVTAATIAGTLLQSESAHDSWRRFGTYRGDTLDVPIAQAVDRILDAARPTLAAVPDRELTRLEVITARDLCAEPDPERIGDLVGPLLARPNRLVVGAATGAGKTTLLNGLFRAVTEGSDFLGFKASGGGRVLMVDAEQGRRTIKRRLRESHLDRSDAVDVLPVPGGLRIERPEEAEAVEAVIAGGDYSAVAFDPLYKLHGGDSNDERAAVDLMKIVDEWRDRYGFALILTTHTRKTANGPKSRFSIDDLFGSGAWVRGAEVVLGLERMSDGYSRLSFFKDRDGDLPPVGTRWGLLFDRDAGFRRDPDDGKASLTAADQISQLLADNPAGLTTMQLTGMTGAADRTVRGALSQMRADSYRGPDGAKTWTLPPVEVAE